MADPAANSKHPLQHIAIIMDGNNRWAKDWGWAVLVVMRLV